jgi:hypothetical protein
MMDVIEIVILDEQCEVCECLEWECIKKYTLKNKKVK